MSLLPHSFLTAKKALAQYSCQRLTPQNALTEPKKNQNANNSNKDRTHLIITQKTIEIKLKRFGKRLLQPQASPTDI
ncbi:MAG: hypothetical protein EBR81_12430 [Proteobacteria bacterium]|nr:hypothetical protein [Pseudomonadota bacterium]